MWALIKSEKVYFYLLLLASVGIGLQLVAYKIAIIALLSQWVLNANFREKFSILKRNNYAIGLIFLFLLYVISLFWSDNVAIGVTDLILKSPLLILPLVILSKKSPSTKQINQILLLFALSSLLLNVYCVCDAYLRFIKTDQINNFYYSALTINMHSAYQAMFTCFAIVVFVYLGVKEKMLPNWLTYLAVSFQMILVLLLSSRMQILIMTVLVPTYLITYYVKKKKLALGILYTVLILSFANLIMSAPSSLNYRYKETVSHINSIGVDNDNSDPRKFIWIESLKVIKDNWFMGAGCGDAKAELEERYSRLILENPISKSLMDSTIIQINKNQKTIKYLQQKGLDNNISFNEELINHAKMILVRKNNIHKSLSHGRFNFHNQYLQTFASIGLFGFLLLLYLLIIPFIRAMLKLEYLKGLLLFIICSSFLTESMLERQAGVAFVAFFYTLLIGRIIQSRSS